MDDATIIIKQNRCFKEVIKDLNEYEEASGAKVNYDKTKGLWVGSWKYRRISPMEIKWTNKNVFSLGVFFGNDNPDTATYNSIVPEIKKRLNYWKQFKLTEIGKARVTEMFLASKLIYAIKFYTIPTKIREELQQSIFNFINFPHKVTTIAQKEMWKTKSLGGIKLTNIQIKSETCKAKWLIELASNPQMKMNLDIFAEIIGNQKGNICGKDILFLQRSYFQKLLKTESKFYKEALISLGNFERRKGIQNVEYWDREHVFYNPLFTRENGKVLSATKYFVERNIYKLEQFLEEKARDVRKLSFDRVVTNLYNKIILNTSVRKEDIFVTNEGKEIKFTEVTQKQLYEQALLVTYRDHHSQVKWGEKLNTSIPWEEVWGAVHNFLSTNRTKNTIWQQVHLNFYTQFSYNKWHNGNDLCPLCQNLPESIYHIILHCEFTKKRWDEIEPTLLELHPVPVSEEEKAFGVVQKKLTNGILLRNWVTYLLRECITQAEKEAYHAKRIDLQKFKLQFNQKIVSEIRIKALQYKAENKIKYFEKIITHAGVLCKIGHDGEYQIRHVFS